MAEVVIENLVLEIPGLEAREAEALGQSLAEALADRLADTPSGHLSHLDLRLPPTALTGRPLADWIAARIVEALP